MARPRGVRLETETLSLSDGDWIKVKKTLTALESRRITTGNIAGYSSKAERTEFDWLRLAFNSAAVYLVGWSFIDVNGAPILWPANGSIDERIAVLGALDEHTFNEIVAALEQHRSAQEAAREKNGTAIAPGTETCSPSASASGGA